MGSSTAQKHHASDKHHSTKRKQPPAGLTAPSPKKAAAADHKTQHEKLSAEAQQALRQRHRQAVSALYTAYEQLSSSGAEAAGDSAAFDVLLDGAKGGTCAQRVAARLIPRFVGRFPLKLEQAATALITITASHSTSKDPESVRVLSKAARPEALHGLAKVCEAASKVTSSSGGAVVAKVAEVLLRQAARLSSETNGRVPASAGSGTSEPACALLSLQAAFRTSTRVVLASSLQGLKSEDGKTRDGSRYFLQQLLAAPQPPGAAGIVLNGHAATNGAAAQCLAAEVLSGQTDTQHWLRNTAKSFCADPPKHRAKEALALLDRLLKELPAAATALPADAPPPEPAPPPRSDLSAPPPLPSATPQSLSAALPPPPPMPAAGLGAAAGGSDDDVHMDLEEGQLAESPISLPPHVAQSAAAPPAAPAPVAASPAAASGAAAASAAVVGAAAAAAPAAAGSLADATAAMRPGGPLCCAAPCLWLGGLPRQVGETALHKECAGTGGVAKIVFQPSAHCDEAIVAFHGMREAALAYEHLCGASPWGGARLDAQFCVEEAAAASKARGRWEPQPAHVWVGGVCNPAGEADVMVTLNAAHLPKVSGVLRVGGARPGLMLQFAESSIGDAALAALRARAEGVPPGGRRDGGAACTVVISTAVHERELLHSFSRFGELARWQLSRGGAVISFHVPGAAAAAVRALDGAPIGPSRIRVALLQGGPLPPDTAVAPAQSPLDSSMARAISATSTPTASPGGMPTAANGRVECIEASPVAAPPGSPAAEPAGWPPLLEVKSRIPTALLMSHKLPAVAEGDRAVRRLAASGDAADRHAFVRFMQYLSDIQRSGVVELGPAAAGRQPRTMYIIPPSRSVCDELRVAWEPQEILLAVVVPNAGKEPGSAARARP